MGRQPADHLDPAPPTAEDDTARLFFALWPDAATRAALDGMAQALREACGGRAMQAPHIHLTLVFLGNVATRRIPELCALAAGIVAPRFELTVDRVDFWPHNRIVWAGPGVCPDELQRLVAVLEGALQSSGFRFDARPYVPHITLLRNARAAPPRVVAGIRWHIADFSLVQSLRRDNSTAYEVVQRWPLE